VLCCTSVKRSDFIEYLLNFGYLPEAAAKTGHVKYRHPETGAWFTLPPDPDVPPVLARGICRSLDVDPPPEVTARRGRTVPGATPGRPRKRRG
jgi:predicted RNA binding protein YcfA (HicA-like mRNA interferase family)